MVKSEIVQIITDNLYPYLMADGVCLYPSNGLTKYVAKLRDYQLEISYEFTDNLYRIRIEERKDNQIGYVFLLTQSKNFHRTMRKSLRENGFSKKDFKFHVLCLCKIVRKQMNDRDNLDAFKMLYAPTLKYDGIFL